MYTRGFMGITLFGAVLAGCQSVDTAKYANDANYINKSYVVTKDQVYMGVRDSLSDGQTVTVVQTFRSPQGLLLIKVADNTGKVIFDTPYSFDDLGLVDEVGDPVQKSIDENKVRAGVLGKQQHGFGKKLYDHDYSYTSVVENTRLDGMVVHGEYRNEGLGAICAKGKTFLTVKQSEIIAAPGSAVSYRIYVDRQQTYEVPAQMATYSALFSSPPEGLIQDLLHGREGVLKITTATTVRTVNFTLDGFAEMYTRVRNNCSQ